MAPGSCPVLRHDHAPYLIKASHGVQVTGQVRNIMSQASLLRQLRIILRGVYC